MNRPIAILFACLTGCAGAPPVVDAPPAPPTPVIDAAPAPPTWPVTEGFKVRLGGNTFIDVPVPVQYAGWPLLTLARLPDGTLGIDLDLHDTSGEVLARVRSSRLSGPEAHRFRATRTDERWTLTEATTGAVLCDLRKRADAEGTVVEVALRLRAPDGTLWEASAEEMDLRNLRFKHNVFRRSKVGIALGAR